MKIEFVHPTGCGFAAVLGGSAILLCERAVAGSDMIRLTGFWARQIGRQPAATDGVAVRTQARRQLALFLGRLAKLGGLISLLLVAGMVGLAVAEDTSLWVGFVWTLDTIATVGSIPSPETTGGQVLKVLLIVLGVGTLFYALVAVTEFFVAGQVTGLLHERRRQRMVDALSDHYLVCGFGRVGRQVVRDLRAAGAQYVVIDRNPESLEEAAAASVPYIEGEAAEEQLLRQAGIERARALIACVDSDAENVFITLTARELRPDMTIVARASGEEAEKKLKRAGAQRVISPYKSSGSEMARLALHPQVAGVVDVAPEYRLEEIEVTPGCPAAGRPLADIAGSTIIAALRRPEGGLVPQPSGDTVLQPGVCSSRSARRAPWIDSRRSSRRPRREPAGALQDEARSAPGQGAHAGAGVESFRSRSAARAR